MIHWTLAAGAHLAPSPDGSTCLAEAAVIASGFKYRKVEWAHDCPESFSRPITAYVIDINDSIPDDLMRAELMMPFVTRLAGTADTEKVERRRVRYIVTEASKRIFDPYDHPIPGNPSKAKAARDLNRYLKESFSPENYMTAATSHIAVAITGVAEQNPEIERHIYEIALKILDEAIMLGNHSTCDQIRSEQRLRQAKGFA